MVALEQVQQTVRRRLLRRFVGQGYLDKSDAQAMLAYNHSGGFSVDASVRIGAQDRAGLERLLRYCARPPFAGQRVRIEGEQVVYRCPKAPAGEQGGGSKRDHEIVLSPLDFIARIAALIPPPRQQWAKLIARIYELDPLRCERCGEPRKIIAFITECREIKAILIYLGLPSGPPEVH